MDEGVNNRESSIDRIEQLERERDELRKDIEQLCMQQAGPSYLLVATRMHFQRTASLEQDIENFKKKLAGCMRDNQNLQEELSEVYHIKSKLADLHSAEVSKNMEAEKQLKFFQGCVASAFAERDHSLMEAEKAKEQEECMSNKVNDFQNRVAELTSECLEEKELRTALQIEVMKLKEQQEIYEKIIDKFYEIRQSGIGRLDDGNREDKCTCLLQDPAEMWSFDDHSKTSTSKYIASLEKELETSRYSIDNLQKKLRVGLEIEEHLRKRVRLLEEKRVLSDDLMKNKLSNLHNFHTQHRCEVMNLLEGEKAEIKSSLDELHEKMRQFRVGRENNLDFLQRDAQCDDIECRDVHITSDVDSGEMSRRNALASSNVSVDEAADTSDALAQALQEKVSALLLLSQQEERHLLERDVNAALQKKMAELQKGLFQVTNEKVKVLMELAQLRQEYLLLQENISHAMKHGNFLAIDGDKSTAVHERDGKLKNLLKRTYLRRWMGRLDPSGNESDLHVNNDESSFTSKKSNSSVDFARLKVENATLQESMSSMEHLTSSIHKLRLALLKANDNKTSAGPMNSIIEALDSIIFEAKLLKTALGSSLPVSWSASADPGSCDRNLDETDDYSGDSNSEKLDCVSAAGFEMVELLIMAARFQKEIIIKKKTEPGGS
ncbi:myosin heavy chain-like protein isoform X2 [Tasmannia lanceolata]|uniref:myosin heavy chain-like protein isoform X2 n=1 Tax=Tasmannia lanceolata TaxID=3420 RepID=UPI004063BBB5